MREAKQTLTYRKLNYWYLILKLYSIACIGIYYTRTNINIYK